MRKSVVLTVAIVLLSATSAHAQLGGGGGRHGHRDDGPGPGSSAPPATDAAPTTRQSTAADQIEIVGVVMALGPEPDRVTIRYNAVEGLNWPAGTTLFVVSKPALLNGITIGEKVRFKLESQHIYQLTPF